MTKFVKRSSWSSWLRLVPLHFILHHINAQGSGEFYSGEEGEDQSQINEIVPEIRESFKVDGFSNFKTEDPFYDYIFQPNFEVTLPQSFENNPQNTILQRKAKKNKKKQQQDDFIPSKKR